MERFIAIGAAHRTSVCAWISFTSSSRNDGSTLCALGRRALAQAFVREIVDCDTVGQLKEPTFGASVHCRFFWSAMAHGAHTRHAGLTHPADACTFIRDNLAGNVTVEYTAKTVGIRDPHLHYLLRLHLAWTPHGLILANRFHKTCKFSPGNRLHSE